MVQSGSVSTHSLRSSDTSLRSRQIYGYNSIEDAIDAAVYLEQSDFRKILIIFRLVTSFLGWITMTFVYSSVRNMNAHNGLVLLLHIHYFWTHAFCSGSIFDSSLSLYESFTWQKPEDLLVDGFICFLRKIPYATALIAGSISLLIIVIERRQASIHVRTYESSGIRLALKLTLYQAIYVIWFFTSLSFLYEHNLIFAFCTGITARTETFLSLAGLTMLIIQMVSLVVFRRLLSRNKQFLLDGNGCLSERYQIKENIRTLKLLVPLVDTQFALNFVPVLMWLLYHTVPHGFDKRAYPIFEESINFVQLYAIIMPLLIIRNQRRDQQKARKELVMNKKSNATDHHIKKIELNW